MNPQISKTIQSMLSGDKRALARLMTYIDNRHDDLLKIMGEVYPHTGNALRLGITGPPGAGKSSLADKLIGIFRKQGKKVGVVAVDPSSPFTGGALLGDRIRMMEHSADNDVFIRSLGTRGSHGGLSRATRDITHLLDAFGMEVVLIETVGVGQTELDIMSLAHATVVVLVPESGDTIQTMKAGLLEIADIFVVNKADRPGANRMEAELRSLSEIFPDAKNIPVFKTEAHRGKGTLALAAAMIKSAEIARKKQPANSESVRKEECTAISLAEIKSLLEQKLEKREWEKICDELLKNPYKAASQILDRLRWK